jgi:hypothetical protein
MKLLRPMKIVADALNSGGKLKRKFAAENSCGKFSAEICCGKLLQKFAADIQNSCA